MLIEVVVYIVGKPVFYLYNDVQLVRIKHLCDVTSI